MVRKVGEEEMTIIFFSLGLGFLIGYKRWIDDKWIRMNSRFQNVWLVILIFVMGMSIGGDREILRKLPVLGGKSVLFAVVCSAGSVLVVYFLSRIFFSKEEMKK